MKLGIEIKEEAREEIATTYMYYEFTQAGLGEKFLNAFEAAANSIILNPKGYEKKYKALRYKLVNPFPYIIIFEIELTRIVVYQVINAKKHPGKRFRK